MQVSRGLDASIRGRARGGHARAAALSAERRREIGLLAARARWRRPRLWTEAKLAAMGYVVRPNAVTKETKEGPIPG